MLLLLSLFRNLRPYAQMSLKGVVTFSKCRAVLKSPKVLVKMEI